MGHWRQPVLLFILPKKPQKMNDFSSFLAVFFYGLMSQSLFSSFDKKIAYAHTAYLSIEKRLAIKCFDFNVLIIISKPSTE